MRKGKIIRSQLNFCGVCIGSDFAVGAGHHIGHFVRISGHASSHPVLAEGRMALSLVPPELLFH